MHLPVLLKEVLNFLDLAPQKFIIDGTLNGGGHSKEILKNISPKGRLLGIEIDKDLLEQSKNEIQKLGKKLKSEVILVNDNYKNLPMILKQKKIGLADGLVLDLGFSSWHVDLSNKGFSFLKNEPLIMTYQNQNENAALFLNRASYKEIFEVLKNYGDEKYAHLIAKKIIEVRKKNKIKTTFDLVNIIKQAVPKNYFYKKIHPATKTFQALRIYLNQELENLKNVLLNLNQILKKGGRVVVISFHSGEDRLVKNIFKKMSQENKLKILTKKPITPTIEEIKFNPRSRSAKLRSAIIL
jgi:16S rRNA (cytosine1402-N4)-methyltransferase